MGRCTGHCCKQFTLPFSPEELWASYNRWKIKANETDPITMGTDQPARAMLLTDIHIVAPMVIYLGHMKIPYRQVNKGDDPDQKFHIYTCKHLDRKTNDCTIYEHRPQVCRDYPYGKSCNYAACTWDDHKATKTLRKVRKARLKILNDPGGGFEKVKGDLERMKRRKAKKK